MAGENHLTYFKVQNFKRFKELEVKDIGQFNLVLGDNNVGKTSFLEALLFDEDDKTHLNNLTISFENRNISNSYQEGLFAQYIRRELYISELAKQRYELSFFYETPSDVERGVIKVLGYRFNNRRVELRAFGKIRGGKDSGSSVFPVNDRFTSNLPEKFKCPLIPLSAGYGVDLVDNYSDFIQEDKVLKKSIIRAMKVLVPSFEDFEMNHTLYRKPIIVFYQNTTNAAMPLGSLGEGAIKLFRILVDIVYFSNQRLMIDEIDTGIHYSRMKDFWKTILMAAKENDVQLFATTHNEECIRYFIEALEEIEKEQPGFQNLGKGINLFEVPESKDIKSITYSFNEFEHSFFAGNELRR